MTGGDPMAALQPLREPTAVANWPPAPGWWLLAALLLAATSLLCWLWLRRYRRDRYRRQGLVALAAIERDYSRGGDPLDCATAVNRLLKTIALKAYPRTCVASLHGDDWLAFLQARGPAAGAFEPGFGDLHYRPPGQSICVQTLLRQTRVWIRCHEAAA